MYLVETGIQVGSGCGVSSLSFVARLPLYWNCVDGVELFYLFAAAMADWWHNFKSARIRCAVFNQIHSDGLNHACPNNMWCGRWCWCRDRDDNVDHHTSNMARQNTQQNEPLLMALWTSFLGRHISCRKVRDFWLLSDQLISYTLLGYFTIQNI